MEFQIRHKMPGRLRIYVPSLGSEPQVLEAVGRWIKARVEVVQTRINRLCTSITVEYKSGGDDTGTSLIAALRALDIDRDIDLPLVQTPSARPNSGASLLPSTFSVGTLALPLSLLGVSGLAPLVVGAVLYAASPSFVRALRVLCVERRLNVDALDSIAITLALGRGTSFTAALLAWLVGLGDAIRDRTAARSKRAIESLLNYESQRAWVLRNKTKIELPVREIVVGDTVIIYAGGLVPVDGKVIKGSATVDQKMITGESMPTLKQRGGVVYAGTTLHEGQLYVRATRVGPNTTAAQIVSIVEGAPVGETRVQNYAEKLADRLVLPTLAISGGLYAVSGNLERLISMVIVDYGTGMRVAAPTAILASMAHAARQGIIIKSGSDIEKLATVETVVFDKTGTITYGEPRICDVLSYEPDRFPVAKLIALTAAAEARLKHPVAHAVMAKAHQDRITVPRRSRLKFSIGLGVEAQIEGYRVHVGNERYFQKEGIAISAARNDVDALDRQGFSRIFVAADGMLVGLLSYADEIRPEMMTVLGRLRDRGIRKMVLLTGDDHVVADAVGRSLGFDEIYSQILPRDKARIIEKLQSTGSVAMVGDGINDSPALAYADIGIALKGGADVTREVANVVLMKDDMFKLVTAIDIAREAMALVHQNYAIIVALNTLAMGLAVPSGLVSPGVTAVISNGSAILASFNAIRPILRY